MNEQKINFSTQSFQSDELIRRVLTKYSQLSTLNSNRSAAQMVSGVYMVNEIWYLRISDIDVISLAWNIRSWLKKIIAENKKYEGLDAYTKVYQDRDETTLRFYITIQISYITPKI